MNGSKYCCDKTEIYSSCRNFRQNKLLNTKPYSPVIDSPAVHPSIPPSPPIPRHTVIIAATRKFTAGKLHKWISEKIFARIAKNGRDGESGGVRMKVKDSHASLDFTIFCPLHFTRWHIHFIWEPFIAKWLLQSARLHSTLKHRHNIN